MRTGETKHDRVDALIDRAWSAIWTVRRINYYGHQRKARKTNGFFCRCEDCEALREIAEVPPNHRDAPGFRCTCGDCAAVRDREMLAGERKVSRRSPECEPHESGNACATRLICQRCDNCLGHCVCWPKAVDAQLHKRDVAREKKRAKKAVAA